jgi:hypothetical protein
VSYSDLGNLVTFRPLDRPLSARLRDFSASPFRASWSKTVALLARELRMLSAKRAVMELDMDETDFRLDGLPRANAYARTPGIVLSFESRHGPLRYEVGTYAHWEDNVRAVALALEALRAVDRYGVTRSGEQYRGWRQLPAGSGEPSADHGHALIDEHGGVTAALKATHPDHGGDPDEFRAVMAAKGSA